MKISIDSDYILRAIYELAKNQSKKPISISTIANNQKIPVKYLEKLFGRLKRSGIIKSIKGKNGGYVLLEKPEDISMKQIIKAAEGNVEIHNCEKRDDKTRCINYDECIFKNFWEKFNNQIDTFLETYKLSEFMDE